MIAGPDRFTIATRPQWGHAHSNVETMNPFWPPGILCFFGCGVPAHRQIQLRRSYSEQICDASGSESLCGDHRRLIEAPQLAGAAQNAESRAITGAGAADGVIHRIEMDRSTREEGHAIRRALGRPQEGSVYADAQGPGRRR